MLSADIGTRLVVFVFFLFFFFPLWRALRGGEVKRGKTFCFLQAPCYFYSGFLQIFFYTPPCLCARFSSQAGFKQTEGRDLGRESSSWFDANRQGDERPAAVSSALVRGIRESCPERGFVLPLAGARP